jgi:hypothetical protein
MTYMTVPTLEQTRAVLAKRSLGRYVEQTSGLKIHPWQWLLCKRLEQLKDQKGQRILIHAPPQHGKSIIVSQRAPLWLLGHNPDQRFIQATYNLTKSCEFSDALRSTASMPEHLAAFPGASLGSPSRSDSWNLANTTRTAEAQYNYRAIGIQSGLTGSGADIFSIDDPYASPEEAMSPTINDKTIRFWESSVKPRINDDTNVIVTFHRYHENDLGGHLLKTGDWELLTFPAEATGNPCDPTGREIGEPLSPIRSLEFYQEFKDNNPKDWYSLFQGEPVADGEKLFEPWMFEDRIIEPHQCPKLTKWYRGVDTATSDKQSADDSATAKVAYDQVGNCFIRMPMTKKVNPAHLNEWMESLILGDLTTMTIVEEHNAGYGVVSYFQRLPAYRQLVKGQKITGAQGSKRQRALILADLARQRKVFIVKECEYQKLLDQLYAFTGTVPGEKDDLIDAITVVQTFIKEQKSDYEPILAHNPYNPANSPSAKRLAEIQARER